MITISMHTDGACKGNQFSNAIGGWAYIIKKGAEEWSNNGAKKNTTNNQMELTALLKGLEFFNENSIGNELIVYSDSAYIVNCFNQKWYAKWERNGWIASKNPVKNKELWIAILKEHRKVKKIQYVHVKGHSGNEYNEKVDVLANEAIKQML
jgi:ribonuclease HI